MCVNVSIGVGVYHPLWSTVKSSLFTHVHSSPLSLAARLHRCHTNHSHYTDNGWTFSGQTSYNCQNSSNWTCEVYCHDPWGVGVPEWGQWEIRKEQHKQFKEKQGPGGTCPPMEIQWALNMSPRLFYRGWLDKAQGHFANLGRCCRHRLFCSQAT